MFGGKFKGHRRISHDDAHTDTAARGIREQNAKFLVRKKILNVLYAAVSTHMYIYIYVFTYRVILRPQQLVLDLIFFSIDHNNQLNLILIYVAFKHTRYNYIIFYSYCYIIYVHAQCVICVIEHNILTVFYLREITFVINIVYYGKPRDKIHSIR